MKAHIPLAEPHSDGVPAVVAGPSFGDGAVDAGTSVVAVELGPAPAPPPNDEERSTAGGQGNGGGRRGGVAAAPAARSWRSARARRRSVADRPVRSVLAARPLRRSASTPRSARSVARRGAGDPGCAERDGVLRVGVDGDGPAELAGDGLRHQGHPRRAADEEHGVQVGSLDAGARRGPAERPERLRQGRGDHRLELPTGQADVGEHARQGDGDDDVAVLGEPFLGRHAGLAQADEGRGDVRVARIERGEGLRHRPLDVGDARRGRSRCRPGARGRRARRASRSRWRCAAARRRRTCRLRGRRPPRCRPEPTPEPAA